MYFQLKQRNPADNNVNMLEEREVEKDLGEILEVTLKIQKAEVGDPKIQRGASYTHVEFQVKSSALNKSETFRNYDY